MPIDVSTVADDLAVIHHGATAITFDGLEPDTDYTLHGQAVHTLARPAGELLCRFATVNDVHFGEVECGRIDDSPQGPILRAEPGAEPYPETMNRGAIAEIDAVDPAAVVVKGDLTDLGIRDQYAEFLDAYGVFGARLYHVRGNHDVCAGDDFARGDQVIDLAGVRVLLLDTAIPFRDSGRITAGQLDWLDTMAAEAGHHVLVMGHHQAWMAEGNRSDDYFGLHPDSSDGLVAVVARHARILGYFAGHTHRNRVRRATVTGKVPFVEVGCVKDFPGSWAEYRVYEGGVTQVNHRISTPDALAWSERCRSLYADFGLDYSTYAAGTLADRCFTMLPRGAG
jgi:3',5'-cyclic-AMP phosphodiesterase